MTGERMPLQAEAQLVVSGHRRRRQLSLEATVAGREVAVCAVVDQCQGFGFEVQTSCERGVTVGREQLLLDRQHLRIRGKRSAGG